MDRSTAIFVESTPASRHSRAESRSRRKRRRWSTFWAETMKKLTHIQIVWVEVHW